MFWYGGGWAFWQVALMWVAMVAFWGLLIWGVWALVAGVGRKTAGPAGGAGEVGKILDERLARGEIDIAEYQRLRDVIAASGGRRPAGAGSGR